MTLRYARKMSTILQLSSPTRDLISGVLGKTTCFSASALLKIGDCKIPIIKDIMYRNETNTLQYRSGFLGRYLPIRSKSS